MVLLAGGSAYLPCNSPLGAIVTAVVSPHNFDLARLAGAAEIVDYHQTDITKRPHTKFDVIIGLNGYHSSHDNARSSVTTAAMLPLAELSKSWKPLV